MYKTVKYEAQSSDVRITVFEKELKCATCNLLGFTKILHNETKGTNLKVMHNANTKAKRHNYLSHTKIRARGNLLLPWFRFSRGAVHSD